MRTESNRVRRLAAVGVVAAGLGVLADRAVTQPPAVAPPPAPEPTLIDPKLPDYGTRPVAYIYGDQPVTRADLAEFLIARGGYEKVELLVNRMIIEREARNRGITVTLQEMEADLIELIKPFPNGKKDFVNFLSTKYGKTLYEYMEDMVRPRLLLAKMCKDRVQVTEDDLKLAFEREYGEKRAVKIVIWPLGDDQKTVFKTWEMVRKDAAEFDRVARQQANPSLAATAGEIRPIARHAILAGAKDKIVETTAFELKEGEVSQILQTEQGYMVIKLMKVLPADAAVKLDGAVRERMHKEMYEVKLSQEIPKQFAELSKAANPTILLNGPPSQWKFEQTNRKMAEEVLQQQQGGGVQPAGGPQPMK